MSHGEYIWSVLTGIEHGSRSAYGATQEISNYIQREIQDAYQRGRDEGYAEGKEEGKQIGYDEAMMEVEANEVD